MENKYFDASVSIADYAAKTGRKDSDYLAEMTRMGVKSALADEEANQK